jgi:small subunit ribosomal protein S4
MHGANKKGKLSEYGMQLREKQKVRRVYGLMERQFRNTFEKANVSKGVTSENFFRSLEMRLDNVVFRMGFARSRNESRQVVSHNHVLVNGKRVNIPSAQVKVGDEVSIVGKSQSAPLFALATELYSKRVALPWFNVDHAKFSGKITGTPTRDDIQMPVRERLIVELYNK